MKIKIDYKKCCWKDGKCTRCGCEGACEGCLEACPVEAVTRDKIVKIDDSKCIKCGACVAACPSDALTLE